MVIVGRTHPHDGAWFEVKKVIAGGVTYPDPEVDIGSPDIEDEASRLVDLFVQSHEFFDGWDYAASDAPMDMDATYVKFEPLSDLIKSDSGLLTEAQSVTFIDALLDPIDELPIPNFAQIQHSAPLGGPTTNNIGFGDGYTQTKEILADVEIPYEIAEHNVEMDDMGKTIVDLIAKKVVADMVEKLAKQLGVNKSSAELLLEDAKKNPIKSGLLISGATLTMHGVTFKLD